MPSPKFQAYGLEGTYPELGTYTFKVVISPRHYRNGQDFDVSLVDSSRRPMAYDVKKWGRKLNVSFDINHETADGVSIAVITKNGQEFGRCTFWVIKP